MEQDLDKSPSLSFGSGKVPGGSNDLDDLGNDCANAGGKSGNHCISSSGGGTGKASEGSVQCVNSDSDANSGDSDANRVQSNHQSSTACSKDTPPTTFQHVHPSSQDQPPLQDPEEGLEGIPK